MIKSNVNRTRMVIFILAAIIIVFGIAFGISWIPRNIDINYPAFVYSTGNLTDIKEQTTISVKGKLRRPFFFNATYRGEINVGYYGTLSGSLVVIEFQKDEDGFGQMTCQSLVDNSSEALTKTVMSYVGKIKIEGYGDKVIIHGILPEDVGTDSTNLQVNIVAPAQTLTEAMQISAK